MDLYIETLTGTAFEMTVSPFDTVMSIKSKIQRVEGKIPGLNIWDCCLFLCYMPMSFCILLQVSLYHTNISCTTFKN